MDTGWRREMAEAIRSADELFALFPERDWNRERLRAVIDRYPLSIPRYYLGLADATDPHDPILRMCVPGGDELAPARGLKRDPFDEEEQMPAPGVIRRYHDRALLLVTSACAMYCRHCTRKRLVGHGGVTISGDDLRTACDYFRAHPEIRDVILSGGDPLAVGDAAIERIIAALRAVASIDVIRVHTRMPVVLPSRVTPELAALLGRYHPLYVNTHFNHPRELTPAAARAVALLAAQGIPLGNQAVLLRGVNDDAATIEALLRGLVKMRVRPYYLFQSDLTAGVEHLRTKVGVGLEIMAALRRRMGGLALPRFVVDMPGGGKIPLDAGSIVEFRDGVYRLRNPEGVIVEYPDPA